ncbi:MAG: hypothetical protein RBR74_11335 [Ignavibacteriaceae bacterium]|jgi:hypothetical protein|nr:hypothetical protein [Ignavibacteriaceae bacterium]
MKFFNINSKAEVKLCLGKVIDEIVQEYVNRDSYYLEKITQKHLNVPVFLINEESFNQIKQFDYSWQDQPPTEIIGYYTYCSALDPCGKIEVPIIYLCPEKMLEGGNIDRNDFFSENFVYLFVKVYLHELAHSILDEKRKCINYEKHFHYRLLEESLANWFVLDMINHFNLVNKKHLPIINYQELKESGYQITRNNFISRFFNFSHEFIMGQPFEYKIGADLFNRNLGGFFYQWRNIKMHSCNIIENDQDINNGDLAKMVIDNYFNDNTNRHDNSNFEIFKEILTIEGQPWD